jgi:hypothetical protein
MTKSTITRERLQELAEGQSGFNLRTATHEESQELARMALAAMDSDPVGTLSVRKMSYSGKKIGNQFGFTHSDAAMTIAEGDYLLYRHPQPAPASEPVAQIEVLSGVLVNERWMHQSLPNGWHDLFAGCHQQPPVTDKQPAMVVQCPFPCGWDNLNKLAIQDAALVARGLVEGEPTTETHRHAAISNNDRLLKVISACRAAMLQAGNHPAIPDRWIPVSDQTPPDKEYVWCWGTYDEVGGPDGFEGYYDASHGKWWASNNGDYVDGGYGREYRATVTHWMPLPATPQEVNNASS